MRVTKILLGVALLAPVALFGTVGVSHAQGIGHQAREGMRDTGDALLVTPSIKSAIIADEKLNNTRNHINVGTKDYVVHLQGHVYNKSLKWRASQIAMRKLHQMHKRYHVSNELHIAG